MQWLKFDKIKIKDVVWNFGTGSAGSFLAS